ncbi:terpene synthase [Stachybotrys elegans]|uniref:Bifunctional lycopene cyclase/phytoene synthase n=1 Tax=Stachybotrys elegans TaxID=80388 RepID=A0A8K0WL77_9HYPO|nr:terpene synthase [Stachybotrys elegans]
MGYDYALVHVKFTIPLAAALSVAARPLISRLDVARVVFISLVAVTATIPWDSYLIRTGVWTYPQDAVLGHTIYHIPVEELFFFFIQTYITALLYILCNKPMLHAQYLTTPSTRPSWISRRKLLGTVLLSSLTLMGGYFVAQNSDATYMGLILAWACPFALITWTLTGDMILAMPWTSTLAPIMIPTMYLWYVDELSLRSGTWSIEQGTKLGMTLFGSLELEEAVFFLVTNTLIVFGLAAFDKAVAVCDVFPELFPEPSDKLPLGALLRARVTPSSAYDMHRIAGLSEAVTRLQKKSRSFYLASSVFPGRLRIELTLLYSYCRLADDLVDNAASPAEALQWVSKLREYLNLRYNGSDAAVVRDFIRSNFEPSAWSALDLLPTHILSSEPLYSLLAGFETDMEFKATKSWPIDDESDLELYASRVASTIGELCLDLVFHHTPPDASRDVLYAAAKEMGVALQFVNIARDIAVDAQISRVYLPTTWLNEEGLSPEAVLLKPYGEPVERMRRRLLGKAFHMYRKSRRCMEWLPAEARGPMTVAVESYMEIGRVLSEGKSRSEGKATVPAWRRLGVVWRTLRSG